MWLSYLCRSRIFMSCLRTKDAETGRLNRRNAMDQPSILQGNSASG